LQYDGLQYCKLAATCQDGLLADVCQKQQGNSGLSKLHIKHTAASQQVQAQGGSSQQRRRGAYTSAMHIERWADARQVMYAGDMQTDATNM